jgi:hypothetical protein
MSIDDDTTVQAVPYKQLRARLLEGNQRLEAE